MCVCVYIQEGSRAEVKSSYICQEFGRPVSVSLVLKFLQLPELLIQT